MRKKMKKIVNGLLSAIMFLCERFVYLFVCVVIFFIAFYFILKGYLDGEKINKGALYVAIGTSLAAAGIVAVIDLWKEVARNRILKRVKNIMYEGGICYLYQKRDLDKYDDLMNNLCDNLDITGYTLNAFYESYYEILLYRAKKNPDLRVRILVVDPDSSFAMNRAEQEGKSRQSVLDSLARIEKFKSVPNIELRKIAAPLTTMIFRIDKAMFVGPHFHKKPSKSTFTMELSENGWLYEAYKREFEALWADSQALTVSARGKS